MLRRLSRLLRRRRVGPPRIVTDKGGFVVKAQDGREFPVRWERVVRVLAYKRDLWTTDEVVLAFRQWPDPELVLEVSEEWPGFADLFEPLERELGVSARWYLDTIGRPFATDFQVVYERPDTGPASA